MEDSRSGECSTAQLLQHLVGQRFQEAELPSQTQPGDWMRNERRRSKTRTNPTQPRGEALGKMRPTQRVLEEKVLVSCERQRPASGWIFGFADSGKFVG